MVKAGAAICVAAVVLAVTSGCGSRHPAGSQGVGVFGVASDPNNSPSPLPSGPGTPTPSPSHSRGATSSPKPKPRPDPPSQSQGPDYSVSTASQPLGVCAWKVDTTSGFSVYQITVTTSYVGPPTDPNERYQVQDGDGDVLADDMIGINAKMVTVTVPDRFEHTSDYTERLQFNLWYQGVDANEKNDTSTVTLSIPYSSSPSNGTTFKPVPCTH